jgi:hypothetical protein
VISNRLVCCSCALGVRVRFEDNACSSSKLHRHTHVHKRARHSPAMVVRSQLESAEHCLSTGHAFFVRIVQPYELFCAKCGDFVYDDRFDTFRDKALDLNKPSSPGSKEKKKRRIAQVVRGIHNMGSTCFLSAALQCLFALPSLNLFFRIYHQVSCICVIVRCFPTTEHTVCRCACCMLSTVCQFVD